MKRNRLIPAVLLVALTIALPGIAFAKDKVTIFHAGSLTVPFAKIEADFEAMHPDIDIQREAGGSTKMARMISELGKPADIMASADFKVIDKSLIPNHADWNIRFATNQLVLCYTDQSKFAGEVNADNWTDILGRKGVVWGHSDPNLDPCGYRSLMVLQLAEIYTRQPGLYDRLVANRPKANVRPKSVELVSPFLDVRVATPTLEYRALITPSDAVRMHLSPDDPVVGSVSPGALHTMEA